MQPLPRHQCLIYQGAPSQHLPGVAAVALEKLQQNYRCLYLNSAPMVAGMRSYMAAAGVDVADEVKKGSLVLTSEQSHLADGGFDGARMLRGLEETLEQALAGGYRGLWAAGDMTWELGPEKDDSKLLEYEWRLEELFHTRPELCGICMYHAGTLPREMTRLGLLVHPTIFVSKTLSLLNPHYVRPASFRREAIKNAELDSAMADLYPHGQIRWPASS
jgi:hypothetical protein